jgi:uncharacterized protein YjbI with pentapeptide repeats
MLDETTASAVAERPATYDRDAWNAYWQTHGMPWRTEPEIGMERQAYLAKRRAVTPNIEQGIYPFKAVEPKLTRADLEWLLATHVDGRGPVRWADEKDKPEAKRRRGLDLRGANLRELDLRALPLTRLQAGPNPGMSIMWTPEQRQQATTDFERATLRGAKLEGANLFGAQLKGTTLIEARLEGATLSEAQLKGANLFGAQLERADLREAQLEGADLREARLEGATLRRAQMTGADLRSAFFDRATALNDVSLSGDGFGVATVADVRWGGVNLAVIEWDPVIARGLGDEQTAWAWRSAPFAPVEQNKTPSRNERAAARRYWRATQAAERLQAFQAAVRANRQVATALRDQGMNEEADQFSYRAQILQRQVFRQQGKRGRWLLWGFLDLIAGFGYKPGRSLIAYLVAIFSFATGFYMRAFRNPAFRG